MAFQSFGPQIFPQCVGARCVWCHILCFCLDLFTWMTNIISFVIALMYKNISNTFEHSKLSELGQIQFHTKTSFLGLSSLNIALWCNIFLSVWFSLLEPQLSFSVASIWYRKIFWVLYNMTNWLSCAIFKFIIWLGPSVSAPKYSIWMWHLLFLVDFYYLTTIFTSDVINMI